MARQLVLLDVDDLDAGPELHSVHVDELDPDLYGIDDCLRAWGAHARELRRARLLRSALDKLSESGCLARLTNDELATLAACLLARMEVES